METTAGNRARTVRVIVVLPLTLFFLFTVAAAAARGAGLEKNLSLAEAIKTALENNHDLRAQKNSLAAGREEIGVARSFLLPKISLEERYSRTVNPAYAFMGKLNQERIAATDFFPSSLNNPDAVNDFQTTLSLEQPLFIKKVNIGLEMSKMEAEAKEADLQRKKEEISFKVLKAYLLVGTAREYVKAAENAREDAREHQRIAEVRYKAELGLYSDTLRAATAVAEAEQKLVSARRNFDLGKRALGLIIGSPEIVDAVGETPSLPLRGLDYYQAEALKRRDVKSLELRKENAKKNIGLAEAAFFPYAGLGGSYQLNDHQKPLGSEGDSWQFMLFFRWDIFDGARRNYEKTKAKYQAAAAEEYLAGMKKMVTYLVYEAYSGVEEARKNMELSREALKTAEEGRRLVKVRYENYLSPLVDLLDTQVSCDHTRANLVARENEYRLSLAGLSYESGTIIKDLQLE